MARKNPADAAKAKAEKQKKMVIVLGVVLALAMAYAVHTMMSLNSSGDPSARPQVAEETTTPAVTPTPSAPPVAPSLGAAGAVGSTGGETSSSSQQLVNAVQAPAGAGQLQSFSLFESKDPFHPGSGGAPAAPSGSGSGSGGGAASPPKTPPAPPTPAPTSAVISVNGVGETVAAGGSFPSATPMFQLVSLTEKTARVSVVGGSYASGDATLVLKVGKPVTLVNTADGTRYTLTLQPQGTVAAAAPTTTTPTATTTTP